MDVKTLTFKDKHGKPVVPTEEQWAIIDAAVNTSESLLINALAGCAKTSTLEMLCQAIRGIPILAIAFNKRIADEMKERLPSHVTCKTINALGHGVWAGHINRKLILNKDKVFDTLKLIMDKLNWKEKSAIAEVFSETIKAVKTAKLQGYIPPGHFASDKSLMTKEEFYDAFDEDVDPQVVDALLIQGIKDAYEGLIDYDDQIYMPTLFGGTFPQFPLVLVDEAQDLSSINHALLDKLVSRRIIAVGDPWQSIYAFRGADTRSMARLRERFKMKEMTLSVTFRCPIAIVRNAHWRVPHYKWAPGAAEGLIVSLLGEEAEWSAASIPDGAAIICRNNAPLFKCALQLLALGRGVKLVGTDLGPSLVRTMKKLGDERMTRDETLCAIDRWEAETARKRKNKGAVADKADCLRVFAEFGETLSAAIAYAEHLFSAGGQIQLLSGHKAKGLEWDTVYHLNPFLVPSKWAIGEEEKEQEYNCKYVIETRAKATLYKVDLKRLVA